MLLDENKLNEWLIAIPSDFTLTGLNRETNTHSDKTIHI